MREVLRDTGERRGIMKNRIIIDRQTPQYKGNFHMHTARSWDCRVPPETALQEYRDKGYDFCAVTDHEVYWNSAALDSEDFITLPGMESAFLPDEELPRWLLDRDRFASLHINLLWDMTVGENGFYHDEVRMRPRDLGLDSWNRYIDYCRRQNQLVIINHPGWSRMEPEIFMGIHGAFAFELWNNGCVVEAGCDADTALWDYCLSRGKRIYALTGDDTHDYGPENHTCGGGFTMVQTRDFSRCGLIRAIKAGAFYPSTGPKIYDMRIVDNVLHMEFDPAVSVRIVARDFLGTTFMAEKGSAIRCISWPVKEKLKYFRVEIYDAHGGVAWSQPVFPNDWDCVEPALREDPHTPIPAAQKLRDENR